MFGTPCRTCGSATAIGRDKAGDRVVVCVVNGHREPLEARKPPRDLASPWWDR